MSWTRPIWTKTQIDFINDNRRRVLYGVPRMKEAEVIPLNTEKRLRGKIVKLDKEADGGGWGFILSNQKKFTRFYFHWSALSPKLNFMELEIGDKVEFDPVDYTDPRTNEYKGWRALRIERI